MRTRLLTIGAASLIAVSAVVAVDAQRADGPRRGGPQPVSDPSVQAAPRPDAENRRPRGRGEGAPGARLDLTEDQQKAVSGILQKTRDETAPIADELALTRRNLHRELFADSRDNGRIRTLAARVATLEQQMLDAQVKSRGAIADLLTPEQKQQARTSAAFERGPGRAMGGGRGLRGPRGPGFQGSRGPGFQGSGAGRR